MQSAMFNAPSKSGSHRQRIAERRENSFIAGWSRSTQHATIRYEYKFVFRIWITYFLIFLYFRTGIKHDSLTTIVAWHILKNQIRLSARYNRIIKTVNSAILLKLLEKSDDVLCRISIFIVPKNCKSIVRTCIINFNMHFFMKKCYSLWKLC